MTSPRPSRAPLFVVLEGIDGSGTTTQLDRLVEHLRVRGRAATGTREPSTGPIGRLLREILLGQHAVTTGSAAGKGVGAISSIDGAGAVTSVDGRVMALLFAADRRDHLAREVEPALAAGSDVVSDRYVMSSLAYQAEEAERSWVETLADGIRLPDLTVLLDVPIAVAAKRRQLAQRPTERYDGDRTLERVAENYRRLAAAAKARWGPVVTIDGSGTADQVARAVAAEVDRLVDADGARP